MGEVSFFLPGASDQEAAWLWYAGKSGTAPTARRVYSLEYAHEAARYSVTVGEPRVKFAQQRGPRGGYLPDAPYARLGSPVGTPVTAILATDIGFDVYSLPPYGRWANPSIVGAAEVLSVEYFAEPAA